MKQLAHKIVAAAVLLLLVVPLAGCRLGQISISIPDFDEAIVEGVSFWRLADRIEGEECYDVGEVIECYDAAGSVIFESIDVLVAPRTGAVRRTLNYSNSNDLEGEMGIQQAVLDESVPGAVSMKLAFLALVDDPASYRIKTFNAAGASGISSELAVF